MIFKWLAGMYEKVYKESQWKVKSSKKTLELYKHWMQNPQEDYSLSYENIKKRMKDGTLGELMYRNGLDNIFNVYQYALPDFKIGHKLDKEDVRLMQMSSAFVFGMGGEGPVEHIHGVLIKGTCRSCGNKVEYYYGCPRCRQDGSGRYVQRATPFQRMLYQDTNWMGARG